MRKIKHQLYELIQKQNLPMEAKVQSSLKRIEEWFLHWDSYERGSKESVVSFSGGLDSTVLLYLVRTYYPSTKAVYVDTGLEFPEIKKFVRSTDNVDIIRPKMTFKQVLDKYGYPFPTKEQAYKIGAYQRGKEWSKKYVEGTVIGKDGLPSQYNISKKWRFLKDAPEDFFVSDHCCYIMKKNPVHKYLGKNKVSFVGTMTDESSLRRTAWLRNGCNAFDATFPTSKPISFWTKQDILEYILKYNIPYCKEVYGDIIEENGKLKTTKADRTGCMFCLFGISQEKRPNRLDRLKEYYPKIYDYIMKPKAQNGLGYDDFLNYVGIEH